MEKIILILSLYSLSTWAVTPSQNTPPPWLLVIGSEKRLSPQETRVWIEDPQRLKAQPKNGRLILKPLKPGQVQIRTSEGHQTVEIISALQLQTLQALQAVTKKIIGPTVVVDHGEVTVEGRLHRKEDYQLLISAVPKGGSWVLRAQSSSSLQQAITQEVRSRLALSEDPPLSFDHELQWLRAASSAHRGPSERQLKELGIRVSTTNEAIETEPVIRVEIAVAEIRRDAMKEYGLGLPTAAQATLMPDGAWSGGELNFKAQLFEKAGHGRMLARPTLLCRSGKEAEFVAGGEFPIKVFNERSQDVIWKKYGILVSVKPKADRSGRISLALSVEVSSIDDARKVDGIPGLLTNRVASHFDLTRPRVIALSGLIKQEDGISREGLMGLSKLPVLGSLFSSKAWREHRTELIIFVRPEIIKERLTL